jgi:hypothetical protein
MSNYLGNQSSIRASVQREGEALSSLGGFDGLGGAFDTGNAAADAIIVSGNAQLARLLQPAWPAIDRLSIPADQKALLKNQPITFYLQLFGMFENLAAEIIVRANQLSGKQERTIGIPRVNQVTVNMAPDQPQDAQIRSPTGRHIIRVLRIADLYMVLVYQAPQYLAAAVAQVFAKYGIQGGNIVSGFVQSAGAQAAAYVQQVLVQSQQVINNAVNVAQQTGSNVEDALRNAAQTVLDRLPPPPSLPPAPSWLRGLGQTGAGEAAAGGEAAATATTATATAAGTGAVSTPFLATMLSALLAALLGAAQGGAGVLMPGQQQQGPPVPGSVRPGPGGDTNGNWVNGRWVPNTGLAALLGSPMAIPVGIGLVGVVLLAASKK